jgi:hypothetical protein
VTDCVVSDKLTGVCLRHPNHIGIKRQSTQNLVQRHDGGNSNVITATSTYVLVGFFPIEHSDTGLLFKSSKTQTVKQTPGCDDFNNKKPQPKIDNLGTHTYTEHPNEYAGGAGSAQKSLTNLIDHGYTPASAKLMEEFLEKG